MLQLVIVILQIQAPAEYSCAQPVVGRFDFPKFSLIFGLKSILNVCCLNWQRRSISSNSKKLSGRKKGHFIY